MTNLWPSDITDTDHIETPLEILQEQASILGQLTKNKVTASIVMVDPTRNYDIGKQLADFSFDFYIDAPALNNYSFRLFSVSHLVTLYPITIHMSSSLAKDIKRKNSKDSVIVDNRNEFLDVLAEIFAAQTTRQLITILLKQSQGSRVDDDIPF